MVGNLDRYVIDWKSRKTRIGQRMATKGSEEFFADIIVNKCNFRQVKSLPVLFRPRGKKHRAVVINVDSAIAAGKEGQRQLLFNTLKYYMR